jgi:hypothetical protein
MRTAASFCISLLLLLADTDTSTAQRIQPPVSFRLDGVSLRASLDSLMRWFPVSVIYLDTDLEGLVVHASCQDCTLEEALATILRGTSLTWVRTANQVILQKTAPAPTVLLSTISGSIADHETGRPLPGGFAVLESAAGNAEGGTVRWCSANEHGFYALPRVPPGTYVLSVRAIGYQAARVPVTITSAIPERLDVMLRPEEIRLQEVTVEGHRTALTPADGYARGVYVRSLPTDQHQYLLDGARIYNPGHFGGVLSTFNPEVLSDVDVSLGGLSPYYGGHIGGFLDLSMRDGSRQRFSGEAGTSSLGSHVALEGPLDGSTAYLVSWRRGYPEPVVPSLAESMTPSPLGTTELVGKMSRRLSGSQHLSLSGYYGSDAYNNLAKEESLQSSNNFGWENAAVSVRWLGIASASTFVSAIAAYTGYRLSLEHILSGAAAPAMQNRMVSDFRVDDLSVRATAEYYHDEQHTLRGGVELIYRSLKGGIHAFSSQIAPLTLDHPGLWELSVYLQDQWAIHRDVAVALGVRATSFAGTKGSFSSVDPRFSLLVSLNETTRLYSSLSTVHQFVHPYRYSGAFLLYPPMFSYPSDDRVRPTTAFQAAVGVQGGGKEYILTAETFYRSTTDLHGFFVAPESASRGDLTDAMLTGSGRSYGLELSVRKREGNPRGGLTYTVSRTEEEYPGINGGQPIPSQFDRRHELQASLTWAPAEGWGVGALCVIASKETRGTETAATASGDTQLSPSARDVSFDVNGNSLPGFQRLELEVFRSFMVDRLSCTVSLRLLNSYGLTDPFVWDLVQAADGTVTWKASQKELDLFPVYPTIGIAVRF